MLKRDPTLWILALATTLLCCRATPSPTPPTPDASVGEAGPSEVASPDAGPDARPGHRLGDTYIPINASGFATLPINLAGGSGSVINVLPTGNQAAQSVTCTGDVSCSGTTASEATTVVSISGTSPVSVNTNTLSWASGQVPALSQAGTSAATGATWTWQPQQSSNTNATGGTPVINLQAPTGTGNETFLTVQRGGTTDVQLGILVGNSAYGALYFTSATPSLTNYALASNGGDTRLNTTVGLTFAVNNAIVGTWNATALNEFSSAWIQNPWQGSATTQTKTITQIPFTGATTTAAATTIYTYAGPAAGHVVTLRVETACVGCGASGNAGGCGAVAGFTGGASATQMGSTASLYSFAAGAGPSISFATSGANILVQANSGISSSATWQGYIVADVN